MNDMPFFNKMHLSKQFKISPLLVSHSSILLQTNCHAAVVQYHHDYSMVGSSCGNLFVFGIDGTTVINTIFVKTPF